MSLLGLHSSSLGLVPSMSIAWTTVHHCSACTALTWGCRYPAWVLLELHHCSACAALTWGWYPVWVLLELRTDCKVCKMHGRHQILAAILATIDQKVRGGEIHRTQQTFQSGTTSLLGLHSSSLGLMPSVSIDYKFVPCHAFLVVMIAVKDRNTFGEYSPFHSIVYVHPPPTLRASFTDRL